MRLALYTTIYPGVEPFLSVWKQSVLMQTDSNIDIWVGIDGITLDQAQKLLSGLEVNKFIISDRPNAKSYIRKKVLKEITFVYDAVILVDSDDVLKPSRVSGARKLLQQYDVIGCAMDFIDEAGRDLGLHFGRQQSTFSVSDLIEFNQFGLSNTAYRCDILKKCLDVPDECELFDWFLITKAWLLGARIYFDSTERMSYRQHQKNTTKILPPFVAHDIQYATECVLKHFSFVLEDDSISDAKKKILENRNTAVREFRRLFSDDLYFSKQYVSAINRISQDNLWWSCVANSNLEALWNQ